MKDNKFSIATAGEAIVFYYFGMDSPTKITNTTAFLLGCGEIMSNKRQDRLFLLGM